MLAYLPAGTYPALIVLHILRSILLADSVVVISVQSGVTSTPLNIVDRVSLEHGGQGPSTPGQAPAVSYRLVKFDSSSGGQLGDNPGRFMLSGESAQASTDFFQTANLAKPAHRKVSMTTLCSHGRSILSASGHWATPASRHES